jgi:hypothetical protein
LQLNKYIYIYNSHSYKIIFIRMLKDVELVSHLTKVGYDISYEAKYEVKNT